MQAFRSSLLALLIIVTFAVSQQKENLLPTNDVCRLFKDGVKLRKPGTCNEEIICMNSKSTQGQVCPDTAKWYSISDKDRNKCLSKQPSDSYCKAPCVKASPTFVTDKKNCNNWYQCDGSKEVWSGQCPENMLFDQKAQICTYDESVCLATYEFCDIVPPEVKFTDVNNCNKYFQCSTKAALQSLTCPNDLYFDTAVGECIKKSQVDCYKHPYPNEVCGNSKIALRDRFVSDQATCRGYFFCKDLGVGKPDAAPIWGQCPVESFFVESEQACMLRSHVKCQQDRCDSRRAGEKELSAAKGCQHYLLCGDGYTVEEIECDDGKWFNAEIQECTSAIQSYPVCS